MTRKKFEWVGCTPVASRAVRRKHSGLTVSAQTPSARGPIPSLVGVARKLQPGQVVAQKRNETCN